MFSIRTLSVRLQANRHTQSGFDLMWKLAKKTKAEYPATRADYLGTRHRSKANILRLSLNMIPSLSLNYSLSLSTNLSQQTQDTDQLPKLHFKQPKLYSGMLYIIEHLFLFFLLSSFLFFLSSFFICSENFKSNISCFVLTSQHTNVKLPLSAKNHLGAVCWIYHHIPTKFHCL